MIELTTVIADSFQVVPTYPKGAKSALTLYRETNGKPDSFCFDKKEKLLPQITKALKEVRRADFITCLEYFKDIQAKKLIKELTKADAGAKLTQVQANFCNYLYLLVADSHILGDYVAEVGTVAKPTEREILIDKRLRHIIELWDVIEDIAIAISQAEYKNVPSTPAERLVLKIFSAGLNVEDLPQRQREYSHGYKYTFSSKRLKGKQAITIREETTQSVATITINDIDVLEGNNKSLKAFYLYVLILIHQQAHSAGVFRRDYIEFSLADLVEKGLYKTIESARKGVNNNWVSLKQISIGENSIIITKKKKIVNDNDDVLFISKRIKNNVCKIFLNPNVNWDIITHFYGVIPVYALSMSNKGMSLVWHIFDSLRMKTKEIKQKGYCDFPNKRLQSVLYLPDTEGCINARRDIREPIEKAICEIEDRQGELLNGGDLRLETHGDDAKTVKEFLAHGFLRVYVSGDLRNRLEGIATNETKKVKQMMRRATKKKPKDKAVE